MPLNPAKNELVDKILEKGQKLRREIVNAVVANDPQYSDTICTIIPDRKPHFLGQLKGKNPEPERIPNRTLQEKIDAYLRGDLLSIDDEKLALEALRSLSVVDLCKITDKTYNQVPEDDPSIPQDCALLSQDLDQFIAEETANIYEEFKEETLKHLKFVDSLRIHVKYLKLNTSGWKKVHSIENFSRNTSSLYTYFIEYKIPEVLTVKPAVIRLCSRQYNQDVVFKQTHCFDLINISKVDLNQLQIVFQINCRPIKSRSPLGVGVAKFTFSALFYCKHLTFNQELPIRDQNGLILGVIRTVIQLGNSRLYFGKELLEATKEQQVFDPNNSDLISNSKPLKSKIFREESVTVQEPQITVIFGYVFVSQAKFTNSQIPAITTFLSCQHFFLTELSYSRIVPNENCPIYDFVLRTPLVYNDELVEKFRDNFLLLEFWQKIGLKNFLLGVSKLPLNQFYVSYRNPVLANCLLKKKLPVIGVDWWEPIENLDSGDVIGHVHVLVALGSQEQIENLEIDRNFIKDSLFKTKCHSRMQNFTTEFFTAEICINAAQNLPSRRKCRLRKHRRYHDDAPSTYVTFDTVNQSHVTEICPKSTCPEWFHCVTDVVLPSKMLRDSNEPLMLKVWRKATTTIMQPNLKTDIVIGYVTVDLTLLKRQCNQRQKFLEDWFDIVDCAGKQHGKLNVYIKPCGNLTAPIVTVKDDKLSLLNCALKRKFRELDEISQRLRSRLSEVTTSSISTFDNNDDDDLDDDNDIDLIDFKRDLNSTCAEEDEAQDGNFDFEKEAENFAKLMEQQQRKQKRTQTMKIDGLLEKLTLIPTENFKENQRRNEQID